MKIKDIPHPEQPIKEVLRVCRKKVGSTHDVDSEELQILIDFIKRRCKNLTTDQIHEAFDMAIDGRFEYLNAKDLVPLKSRFTQAFLNQIISPYITYKAEISRSQQRKELSETKNHNKRANFLKHIIEPYEKGEEPNQELTWLYYQNLNDIGINLSNETITKKYKDMAAGISGKDKERILHKLRKELKAELFNNWWKESKEFDLDIRTLIMSKL